jgi:hypothetical protein
METPRIRSQFTAYNVATEPKIYGVHSGLHAIITYHIHRLTAVLRMKPQTRGSAIKGSENKRGQKKPESVTRRASVAIGRSLTHGQDQTRCDLASR